MSDYLFDETDRYIVANSRPRAAKTLQCAACLRSFDCTDDLASHLLHCTATTPAFKPPARITTQRRFHVLIVATVITLAIVLTSWRGIAVAVSDYSASVVNFLSSSRDVVDRCRTLRGLVNVNDGADNAAAAWFDFYACLKKRGFTAAWLPGDDEPERGIDCILASVLSKDPQHQLALYDAALMLAENETFATRCPTCPFVATMQKQLAESRPLALLRRVNYGEMKKVAPELVCTAARHEESWSSQRVRCDNNNGATATNGVNDCPNLDEALAKRFLAVDTKHSARGCCAVLMGVSEWPQQSDPVSWRQRAVNYALNSVDKSCSGGTKFVLVAGPIKRGKSHLSNRLVEAFDAAGDPTKKGVERKDFKVGLKAEPTSIDGHFQAEVGGAGSKKHQIQVHDTEGWGANSSQHLEAIFGALPTAHMHAILIVTTLHPQHLTDDDVLAAKKLQSVNGGGSCSNIGLVFNMWTADDDAHEQSSIISKSIAAKWTALLGCDKRAGGVRIFKHRKFAKTLAPEIFTFIEQQQTVVPIPIPTPPPMPLLQRTLQNVHLVFVPLLIIGSTMLVKMIFELRTDHRHASAVPRKTPNFLGRLFSVLAAVWFVVLIDVSSPTPISSFNTELLYTLDQHFSLANIVEHTVVGGLAGAMVSFQHDLIACEAPLMQIVRPFTVAVGGPAAATGTRSGTAIFEFTKGGGNIAAAVSNCNRERFWVGIISLLLFIAAVSFLAFCLGAVLDELVIHTVWATQTPERAVEFALQWKSLENSLTLWRSILGHLASGFTIPAWIIHSFAPAAATLIPYTSTIISVSTTVLSYLAPWVLPAAMIPSVPQWLRDNYKDFVPAQALPTFVFAYFCKLGGPNFSLGVLIVLLLLMGVMFRVEVQSAVDKLAAIPQRLADQQTVRLVAAAAVFVVAMVSSFFVRQQN